MIRSLVVVALVFLNSCEGRSTCLAYDDIVTSSIQDLDLDAYQGVWFVASTNEPTEPAACRYDHNLSRPHTTIFSITPNHNIQVRHFQLDFDSNWILRCHHHHLRTRHVNPSPNRHPQQ
ncbi:hypothetical protein B484DRAFT_457435 [Ochromonadaceae sp. CCMP2298]|nr:hypothetical protein B484DRAFT_457435 [Ochromonadaceae sp. CCMP2298]